MADGPCSQSLGAEKVNEYSLCSQSGWHEGGCQSKAVLKGHAQAGHLEEPQSPAKAAHPPRADGEAGGASGDAPRLWQGNQVDMSGR